MTRKQFQIIFSDKGDEYCIYNAITGGRYTMTYLRSFEEIVKMYKKISDKKLDPVYEWVMNYLMSNYPAESVDLVLGEIDMCNNEHVLGIYIDYLNKFKDEKFLEPFRKCYREHFGETRGKVALVLAEMGDETLVDQFNTQYDSANLQADDTDFGYINSLIGLSKINTEASRQAITGSFKQLENKDVFLPTRAISIFMANLGIGIDSRELIEWCLVDESRNRYIPILLCAMGKMCGEELEEEDINISKADCGGGHCHEHSDTCGCGHTHDCDGECDCGHTHDCDGECDGDACDCKECDEKNDPHNFDENEVDDDDDACDIQEWDGNPDNLEDNAFDEFNDIDDNDNHCGCGHSHTSADYLSDTLDFLFNDGQEFGMDFDGWHRFFNEENHNECFQMLYRCVQNVIEKQKGIHGEEKVTRWLSGQGTPRENILYLSVLSEKFDRFPVQYKLMVLRTGVYILAGLLEKRDVLGRFPEEMNPDTMVEFLLEDRTLMKEDIECSKLIKTFSPEIQKMMYEKLLNVLPEITSPHVLPRVTSILCDSHQQGIFEKLFKLELPNMAWELISKSAVDLGETVLDMIGTSLENDTASRRNIPHYIKIIEALPVEKSVQLCLDYWETFWNVDKIAFVHALQRLGDRRFLLPLKAELKEGELDDIQAYIVLCRLNGIQDSYIKKLEKELKENEKRSARIMMLITEKKYDELLKIPARFLLKCRKCGKSYLYEVNKVEMYAQTQEVVIRSVIFCKNCGSMDNYTIELDPLLPLSTFIYCLNSMDEFSWSDDYVLEILPNQEVDGEILTLEERYEMCTNLLAEAPRDIKNLLMVAQVLLESKRSEEAIRYLELVTELAPENIDSLFMLASLYGMIGNNSKYYNYALKTYQLLYDAEFIFPLFSDPAGNREYITANVYELLADACRKTKKKIPPEVIQWLNDNMPEEEE